METILGLANDALFSKDSLDEDNVFILRPKVADTAESSDSRKVPALFWLEFLNSGRTSTAGPSLRKYAESLDQQSAPVQEIRHRLRVLRGQFTEQPEGIEMIYDPLCDLVVTRRLADHGGLPSLLSE